MDLWVRSQDREDLIKVDNIGLAYKGKYNFIDNDVVDDKFYICQFTNEFHSKLGSYATKERALEILDEIQRIIEPRIKFQEISTSGELDNGLSDAVLNTYTYPVVNELGTYVYEMPEK